LFVVLNYSMDSDKPMHVRVYQFESYKKPWHITCPKVKVFMETNDGKIYKEEGDHDSEPDPDPESSQ
jgi:hypothetical protein